MQNNPPIFSIMPAGLMGWAAVCLALAIFSCGRKTLPLPPDAYVPPAVKALTAAFEAGRLSLSWVVPDGQNQLKKGLHEMVVFQADRADSCPGCPLVFEPIATISARKMLEIPRGDLQATHTLAVDSQGPFAFYVVAYSKTGLAGPQSDIVHISCSTEER